MIGWYVYPLLRTKEVQCIYGHNHRHITHIHALAGALEQSSNWLDDTRLNEVELCIDSGKLPHFLRGMLIRESVDLRITKQHAHVAAGLFKLFYRMVPEPLIPFDAYELLTNAKNHDAWKRP